MALNVEQIENRLAMMQDAELQKYAAMNKNDPYIMALAVSESNRRKKVRQAQQGMQGQMPQPKVVDAAVQGMAAPMPEAVGIGQLPAGPMNFADGGIVAFADGGDVERYQSKGLVAPSAGTEYGIPGMVTGSLYQDALAKAQRGDPLTDVEKALLASSTPLAAAADVLSSPITGFRRLVRSPNDTSPLPSWTPATDELKTRLNTFESLPQASYSNEGRQPSAVATQPGAVATQPTATDKTAPKVDTTQRTAAPGAGVGTNTSDLQALYKKLQGPADKELTELRNQRELFSTALQDFAKKEQTAFETEEAKRGDVFKGRQERIAQQEAKLEGMKDQNLGLALLQAGAAMMSTPGGLGVALGKGVNAGTERYVAGIDKLNAAQDRLMDAKDRLEELRVNREDMTAKERRALASQVNRSVLEGKKLFLDGAEKDLGYRREDAKTLFSGIVTDLASQRSAGATVEAARIRSQDTKAYLEAVRGGSMVENARKNIMAEIIKANPYADEPTRQRLFQAEWAKALQNNPALAQYAGGASGGGSAPASFVFNAKTGQIEPAR